MKPGWPRIAEKERDETTTHHACLRLHPPVGGGGSGALT